MARPSWTRNLDMSKTLTARGSVDSEGESTLDLFYERDY